MPREGKIRFIRRPVMAALAYVKSLGLDEAERHELSAIAASRHVLVSPLGIWLEVVLDNRWVAAYRLVAQHGSVVVGELRIFPHEGSRPDVLAGEWSARVLGVRAKVLPRGGIGARLLRKVRIGEHYKHGAEFFRALEDLDGDWLRRDLERDGLGFDGDGTPGRGTKRTPRRPDLFYARLADSYVKACRRSRRPIADLAERRNESQARIRDLIHAARKRGLLSRVQRGRPGGELTTRARMLLPGVGRRRR